MEQISSSASPIECFANGEAENMKLSDSVRGVNNQSSESLSRFIIQNGWQLLPVMSDCAHVGSKTAHQKYLGFGELNAFLESFGYTPCSISLNDSGLDLLVVSLW